jgi:3-oxoacyl-[acyl-carrier protein] reductase
VTVAADLRELAGCEAVAAAVRERCKRCDILVNNAGATQAGNFLNLPDSAWIDGYALKLFGCVRMTRLLWPMLKESQGHVVNIIDFAARTPGSDFLIVGSVNAAMANFSKGLAQLGKRDGVNVNVIHPGTTFWRSAPPRAAVRSKSCGAKCSQGTDYAASATRMTSRRWHYSCAPNARAISRAPRSRSTAARHPGFISTTD